MLIGAAGSNPAPVTTRVEPTAPEVAEVRAPLDTVYRDTVGPAAAAREDASRKTVPTTPARNSSPIVAIEAVLVFGVTRVRNPFTCFRDWSQMKGPFESLKS